MSKYKAYAEELDKMARDAIISYLDAKGLYDKAVDFANKHPERDYPVPAADAAAAQRGKADLIEARENLRKARREMENKQDKFIPLRRELEKAVADDYAANPKAIDAATITLLNSEILKPDEYQRLYNAALVSGNHTMARLIGEAAGKAVTGRFAKEPEKAQVLRVLENDSRRHDGREYLEQFDEIVSVYRRCIGNDVLAEKWVEFIAPRVENF